MPETAIQETAIRHVKNVVYNPKCGPLRLYGWCKRRAVINCDLAHVHRPAGIDVACVHIKREDEMLLGVAAVRCDHCVKKKPARGKIDNGCAGNTEGVNIRSEEHTSELQSRGHLVCRLLLEKKKTKR